MLGSSTSKFRETVSRPYVCRQCSIKLQRQVCKGTARYASTASLQDFSKRDKLWTGIPTKPYPGVLKHEKWGAKPGVKPPAISIRDRLQQWQIDNPDANSVADVLPPKCDSSAVINSVASTLTGDFYVETEAQEEEDCLDSLARSEHDLVDVGLRRNFLLPGDLVNIASVDLNNSELAVYIQSFSKQSQFYSLTGRWMQRTTTGISFTVPNFIDPAELEDLKPWLPNSDVDEELRDKMQSFNATVVPRNVGKPVIQKMAAFVAEADQAYRKAATAMDNAHKLMANWHTLSYAPISQIADKVLTNDLWKGEDGKFAPAVLYALYRTMMRDGVGFQPHPHEVMRGEAEFEIAPRKEVMNLENIARHVREHRGGRLGQRRGLPHNDSLKRFVRFARQVIDESRKSRDFTPYGMLGPLKQNVPEGSTVTKFDIDPVVMPWIHFLESWACFETFRKSSYFNGIGSQILRAIDRYPNVSLDKTTAYTCLMELGAIAPWQNSAAFLLRLPSVTDTAGAYQRRQNLKDGVVSDTLAGIRKDWKGLNVYCIDDVGAYEIDDGISVEPTEDPEEFWLHVHVADPAAHLEPHSPATFRAQFMTVSVYHPELMNPLLDSEWVQSKLSLRDGAPCLTHSIRLNRAGEILEVNVTPHIINNVVYTTHSILTQIITGQAPPAPKRVHVGKQERTFDAAPSRKIFQRSDFSDKQLDDLRLLQQLAQFRHHHMREKGAVGFNGINPEASVSFGSADLPPTKRERGTRYGLDPSITLVLPDDSSRHRLTTMQEAHGIVAAIMLTASEATAQWCNARGVPVIYKISPFNPSKEDPRKYFRENVRPFIEEAGNYNEEAVHTYLHLIGKTQPSTVPGPHLGIGADMTLQCTSPLRRFGDLINQWQMEVVLLKEAETGSSLVGNTNDDFLPFSKADLDRLLPRLAEREKLVLDTETRAHRAWVCKYLVRAWKYGEDKLPSPLRMEVRSLQVETQTIGGLLLDINTGGDIFEVELADVNAYSRRITANVIRRISGAADSAQSVAEAV